jgi:hypothetical protein
MPNNLVVELLLQEDNAFWTDIFPTLLPASKQEDPEGRTRVRNDAKFFCRKNNDKRRKDLVEIESAAQFEGMLPTEVGGLPSETKTWRWKGIAPNQRTGDGGQLEFTLHVCFAEKSAADQNKTAADRNAADEDDGADRDQSQDASADAYASPRKIRTRGGGARTSANLGALNGMTSARTGPQQQAKAQLRVLYHIDEPWNEWYKALDERTIQAIVTIVLADQQTRSERLAWFASADSLRTNFQALKGASNFSARDFQAMRGTLEPLVRGKWDQAHDQRPPVNPQGDASGSGGAAAAKPSLGQQMAAAMVKAAEIDAAAAAAAQARKAQLAANAVQTNVDGNDRYQTWLMLDGAVAALRPRLFVTKTQGMSRKNRNQPLAHDEIRVDLQLKSSAGDLSEHLQTVAWVQGGFKKIRDHVKMLFTEFKNENSIAWALFQRACSVTPAVAKQQQDHWDGSQTRSQTSPVWNMLCAILGVIEQDAEDY